MYTNVLRIMQLCTPNYVQYYRGLSVLDRLSW